MEKDFPSDNMPIIDFFLSLFLIIIILYYNFLLPNPSVHSFHKLFKFGIFFFLLAESWKGEQNWDWGKNMSKDLESPDYHKGSSTNG